MTQTTTSDATRLKPIIDAGWALVAPTIGYLSEREARFVMTAAALAPGEGEIVEIGSFKGRSTVGLAHIARTMHRSPVVAIDPHTSPSTTDPDLGTQTTSFDDFQRHLAEAGVSDMVEVHRAYSYDVAKTWTRPIRFLWIDGDHTYEGAGGDLRLFKPFLVPGAIVAMHDVLGTFEGCLRVFAEDVLGSDDFGRAGLCGSIGWAQYRPQDGRRFHKQRERLAFPVRRLIPIAQRGRQIHGVIDKYAYKLWRAMAPHGDIDIDRFAAALR